ncbi:MAG: prolyl oligopeptidase family serine peptidase [Hyphomicrobiales bacterium]|nr:prolyl oligopeptidase family serine peptidase [Hyphomicrobiales bacterium]
MQKIQAPFGAWTSALDAGAAAAASLRFGRVETFGGAVYWAEGRPAEGGRVALMRLKRGGEPEELLPAPFSARTRVHEYGGGEFYATALGVFFVNDADQQVWLREESGGVCQITDAPGWRFADFAHDARRDRLICVGEIHNACLAHPRNVLAEIDLCKSGAQAHSVFLDGADFYAAPCVSEDGSHLAWLQWSLPAMPWDAAEVYMSTVDEGGALEFPRRIAGGGGYAAFQPEWAPDNWLFFVADKGESGELFRSKDGTTGPYHGGADLMRPLWSFNQRSYALLDGARAAVAGVENGGARLGVLNLLDGEYNALDTRLRSIEHIAADGDAVVCIGATDDAPAALVRQPLDGGPHEILRAGGGAAIGAGDISVGESVRLTDLEREAVYGVYYPPCNARFEGMRRAAPPVIITCHGGPTGHSPRGFKARTQFFTNRGFAVFDLDYSGSTGYGRDYRERLNGHWGERDAADAEAAARHLIATGQAARGKVFVYGSSAGGLTVLAALARTDVFAGGVSAYGISDLEALQRTTHKFESGYIYGLIGADPDEAQGATALMRERSPITHADEIKTPVLLLQGADDKVVPPQQSELIAASLKARGVPCELILFEGEGHGFRRAEAMIAALEAELAFYRRILSIRD